MTPAIPLQNRIQQAFSLLLVAIDAALGRRPSFRATLEPLNLRNEPVPDLLVVIRLGSLTLEEPSLRRSVDECHERWGVWGFSVLEVPGGDYQLLARLRPIVATRRMLFVARGIDLIDAGFPVLPTLDHPHWTVVLSAPSAQQFSAVRECFDGPIPNPVWTAGR